MRGSKRRLPNGAWELRVALGRDPVTGEYRRLSKTFRGTARQADEELRELIGRQSPDASGVGATLGQLLDQWLAEGERLDLSPTTLRTYRAQIDRTIRPRLGRLPLVSLTSKHLDDLYRALKDAGRSPKTVRNYHAILSAALHQAVRWGWIGTNVAERAKPPRISQRRVEAPSIETVRAVIEEAETRDPRQAPLLVLAALTGMRRGELCALRWSDVDLERGVIDVSRSVAVVSGGITEKGTKTHQARRVALDPVGVGLLTQHRARATSWAEQAGGKIADDGFVFSPYVDGLKPFRPDNVTSFFGRVRDAVGALDVRLHDLRHFTATQLIGAGVDVRTVAGRLGHADPSMTLRVYSHMIEERERAAAAIMGSVMAIVSAPRSRTE
ncbi:MAG: tyrosine-type recombinase/integrase [Acidimicrobiales bacterium]